MMSQNGTHSLKKVATDIDRALLKQLDSECKAKRCSRADIIRWAIMERYGKNTSHV
ncbi:ribbon-helix-helix protein, CopG family [Nitrospira sp. BLG_1]|uniref:ribbon-helix-helix protein, CopG family n=1 Tax=Nitrospira sp. BLG_1 TaxID=3395883 RepID=UPI0039BD0E17